MEIAIGMVTKVQRQDSIKVYAHSSRTEQAFENYINNNDTSPYYYRTLHNNYNNRMANINFSPHTLMHATKSV